MMKLNKTQLVLIITLLQMLSATTLLSILLAVPAVIPAIRGKAQGEQQEESGIVERIKSESTVPVFIPESIEVSGQDIGENFWTYLLVVNADGYIISLDRVEGCMGAGVCDFGHISGRKLREEETSLEEILEVESDRIGRMRQMAQERQEAGEVLAPAQRVNVTESPSLVLLGDGNIEGIFLPSIRSAQCSDAKVAWDYRGARFSAGIECGSKTDVLFLANSIIDGIRGERHDNKESNLS